MGFVFHKDKNSSYWHATVSISVSRGRYPFNWRIDKGWLFWIYDLEENTTCKQWVPKYSNTKQLQTYTGYKFPLCLFNQKLPSYSDNGDLLSQHNKLIQNLYFCTIFIFFTISHWQTKEIQDKNKQLSSRTTGNWKAKQTIEIDDKMR